MGNKVKFSTITLIFLCLGDVIAFDSGIMSWLNYIYPSYFCTLRILVKTLFNPSQEKEKIINSLINFVSVRIPGDFTFKAFQFQRMQMDMLWNFQKLWNSQSTKSARLFWNSESQGDRFSKIICEFQWLLRTSIL